MVCGSRIHSFTSENDMDNSPIFVDVCPPADKRQCRREFAWTPSPRESVAYLCNSRSVTVGSVMDLGRSATMRFCACYVPRASLLDFDAPPAPTKRFGSLPEAQAWVVAMCQVDQAIAESIETEGGAWNA